MNMEYEQVCHWSCWSRHMQADRWWIICWGGWTFIMRHIFFVLNMYTIHLISQSDISRGHLHLITGYYRDGVPVYGLCKDSSGMVSLESGNLLTFYSSVLLFLEKSQVMSSCYSCTGSCSSSVTHVCFIHPPPSTFHPTAKSLPSIHSLTYKPYIHVKYLNKKSYPVNAISLISSQHWYKYICLQYSDLPPTYCQWVY